MVAVAMLGIGAVGDMRPVDICKVFGLPMRGPVITQACVMTVLADYFLQKDDIGIGGAQGIAQTMQGEAPVAKGETFVDVA